MPFEKLFTDPEAETQTSFQIADYPSTPTSLPEATLLLLKNTNSR